jgi:hypothetical protein
MDNTFVEKLDIALYHLRNGLSPEELAKADVVGADGLFTSFATKPGPEIISSLAPVHWWISEWAHNEISFALLASTSWKSNLPNYVFIEGGCDYTGWGCQSGASLIASDDMDDLIRWGLGAEDRRRWNLVLDPPAGEEVDGQPSPERQEGESAGSVPF